jgi:hypothetical protein
MLSVGLERTVIVCPVWIVDPAATLRINVDVLFLWIFFDASHRSIIFGNWMLFKLNCKLQTQIEEEAVQIKHSFSPHPSQNRKKNVQLHH